MPRVCVFGCRTGGLKLHVFPIHDAERFKTWVEVVSRNMGTPADCGYYKQKRICDKHFADEHKVANNRVSNNAVPTLYLNGNSSEIGRQKCSSSVQPPTQMNQILCQSSTASAEVIEMDHDYCRPTVILSSKENLTTNYQSSTKSTRVIAMDRDHGRPTVILSSKENLTTNSQSSTESAEVEMDREHNEPVVIHSSKENLSTNYQSSPESAEIEMDRDSSEPVVIQSSKENLSTKHPVSVTKSSDMSRLKTIQRQVKNLKREILRLRKKGRTYKARLQNAEKLNNTMALRRVTKNMTSASRVFTELQFRETSKRGKGRRFKLEEKLLALSLYKRSPHLYPLLSDFFTLPSATTLKQLLSKIK